MREGAASAAMIEDDEDAEDDRSRDRHDNFDRGCARRVEVGTGKHAQTEREDVVDDVEGDPGFETAGDDGQGADDHGEDTDVDESRQVIDVADDEGRHGNEDGPGRVTQPGADDVHGQSAEDDLLGRRLEGHEEDDCDEHGEHVAVPHDSRSQIAHRPVGEGDHDERTDHPYGRADQQISSEPTQAHSSAQRDHRGEPAPVDAQGRELDGRPHEDDADESEEDARDGVHVDELVRPRVEGAVGAEGEQRPDQEGHEQADDGDQVEHRGQERHEDRLEPPLIRQRGELPMKAQ